MLKLPSLSVHDGDAVFVSVGTLEFVGEIDSHQRMTFIRGNGDQRAVSRLTFHDDGSLEVDEENWIGEYGMNVSFIGMYRRAGLTN